MSRKGRKTIEEMLDEAERLINRAARFCRTDGRGACKLIEASGEVVRAAQEAVEAEENEFDSPGFGDSPLRRASDRRNRQVQSDGDSGGLQGSEEDLSDEADVEPDEQ